PAAGTGIESLRLQEALARATATFQAGDYSQAVEIFNAIEQAFGREPELQEPAVQKILLPAWGYSAFVTQDYPAAIERFEQFLEQFPEPGSVHAFVLYTLGQAEQLNGSPDQAARRFAEFVAAYPGSPETSLAALQQADLLFQSGETEEALALTADLYESGASPTLRTQARLRALQELVDLKDIPRATEILLGTPWNISRMPELAVLAFAALQTGDALMQQGNFPEALAAYRLVPPYPTLLSRQRSQLETARQVLQRRQRTSNSPMASAWNSYYGALVARLSAQLEALETMQDYTPGFLLRYGQAFLSNGRGREALLLFRDLALDESLPPEIRQQAHYRWILADFFLQQWEDTLAVALDFEERYPESPLAPEALYLVAQAHQEQQKYRQAIEVYDELLERFPANPLAPRWLFTRGFNLAMLEQYPESREDFSRFAQQYPDHPLKTQARLWHGLTHQFEGNYELALEELTPLAADSTEHHLYPEIRYRIATAHYALQDYPTARRAIEEFLTTYPNHARAPEALVLKGDILMGQGELLSASSIFASVSPEAGSLFPYAVFQRGKIFKALERYDLMIDHFSEYLEREDLTTRPRLSEALYWLGWAYLKQGQPDQALARFDQALVEYGDDPNASEIQALLSSLQSLRADLLRQEEETLPDHPLLNAPDFSTWLDEQIEVALAEDRLTWFSRLKYFQANQQRARGEEEMAQTLLQEIDEKVPLERLDPQVIGQIGLIYSASGYQYASDYFNYILQNYPTHAARAEAWFGLAQDLYSEEELEEADDLLRKFENEIPVHPLSPRVKILRGRILTRMGYYDDAEKTFEDILKLKSARGTPHARALAGLAEMNEARGNRERAVPYWQRIYTLYRAYPDLVAEAYLRSAYL
ncbi:MAG: tetratricopeptide repeat protein, partial [Puniceicoccales bacterium]